MKVSLLGCGEPAVETRLGLRGREFGSMTCDPLEELTDDRMKSYRIGWAWSNSGKRTSASAWDGIRKRQGEGATRPPSPCRFRWHGNLHASPRAFAFAAFRASQLAFAL